MSAGPGSSGGGIRADGTNKLIGVHIAGHRFVAGREFPNYAIPGAVVAQAMRKYCGESALPYYSQAFELTYAKVLEEVAKIEEVELITQMNTNEKIVVGDKTSHKLAELLGDPVCSEACVDPSVWRAAVRKLKKSGGKDANIKALLYRKISGRVPEWDEEHDTDDEEMWKQVEEDIRDQIYGDSLHSFVDCVSRKFWKRNEATTTGDQHDDDESKDCVDETSCEQPQQ